MTAYFSQKPGSTFTTTGNLRASTNDLEGRKSAEEFHRDIKSFEKAKKVAQKNRFPNTSWAEYPNFN